MTALKEAMARSQSLMMAELQAQKNVSDTLQRELGVVYEELSKANTLIVEQKRKLSAHDAVAELEQKLHFARRLAS